MIEKYGGLWYIKIKVGAPVGELSAQPTEGLVLREEIKVKSEKKW